MQSCHENISRQFLYESNYYIIPEQIVEIMRYEKDSDTLLYENMIKYGLDIRFCRKVEKEGMTEENGSGKMDGSDKEG